MFFDILRKEPDQLDDLLCKIIAGGGFRTENKGARKHGKIGIFQQIVVKRNDMHRVEQLTFIFVHAFCLHVEYRVGIDDIPFRLFCVRAELLFFNALDLVQAFQNAFVVFEFFEIRKLFRVLYIAVADGLV